LSENPRSREHIHPVFLSASHYIAVAKLYGSLEIGKSASILLALNEGLYRLGVLSQEDYESLDRRYRRKLRDVILERQSRRESSHVPVLTIEQTKEKQLLETKDKQLKGVLEQWDSHPDPQWRAKVFAEAERFKDKLESARLLLARREGAI
jgi:hypothetical protein